ncbi:hypothetical protein ASE16_05005 [Leifsonia sp. Root227]|uniref:TetR/AcrR family transcriptional regulator n=1 Tax=Leifsonia sp. Root227 TaxID=1736496 RepID=UPI0006FCC9C6|nr:TetR/AcrR family transcriptional regulator [Leifsonia sp. Root227]KRC50398.1 hypothetical protein ASE16_05005 [Leifsonia sp. Root227]
MKTFPPAPEPGLRERKKAQTRASLERAAVALVLERPIDDVTIDEICAAVPVSHRTFFNYFDCKEDALLGFRHAWGDAQLVGEHLARTYAGSIVACVVETLVRGLPSAADPDLQEARMIIASRNPGLIQSRMRRLDELRTGLVGCIAELMLREQLVDADSPVPAEAQAELVVVACIGSIRIALREWAETGATGTSETVATRATAIAKTLAPLVV